MKSEKPKSSNWLAFVKHTRFFITNGEQVEKEPKRKKKCVLFKTRNERNKEEEKRECKREEVVKIQFDPSLATSDCFSLENKNDKNNT